MLLYLAPCLIGDPARGIAMFPGGLAHLSDRVALALHEVTRIGDDVRLRARVVNARRADVHRNLAAVGKVAAVAPKGDGLRLVVAPGALDIADVAIGDSIAVNGCCLTVVAKSGATLGFDVSAETLACTAGLDGAADVNLEKCAAPRRPPGRTPRAPATSTASARSSRSSASRRSPREPAASVSRSTRRPRSRASSRSRARSPCTA